MSTTPKPKLRSAPQVRAEFQAAGISLAQWARTHKVSRQTVYNALSGRPCLRGQAHKVAVLLGLKAGQLDVQPSQMVAPGVRRAAR